MPLLTDGDITKGWVRERTLLKKLYEQTFMQRSPVFRKYVEGVAKATDLPKEKVIRSRAVRRFLEKLTGLNL